MNEMKPFKKSTVSAAIALVIGVGIAIGASIGSFILGIIVMLPLGIAMMTWGHHNQSSEK